MGHGQGGGAARRRVPAHHADAAAANGKGGRGGEQDVWRQWAMGRGGAAHRTTRSRCLRRRLVSAKRREARQKTQGRWHRCGSRRAKRTHPRHALVRHTLEQADVEVHPAGARRGRVRGAARGGAARRLDGRRRRTHPTRRSESEGRWASVSCRGARGRGGVCAARQRTTPSIFVNGRAAVVCQSDGERRIRLFSVSRMRLSAEKRVVRMGWLGPRVAGLRSRRRNRTLAVERICGRKKDCLEKSEVRCGGARGYEAHPESGRSPPDVHCNPSASPGTP